ncbi:MAG: hypothetical protein AAGI68_11015 [Planctomycetota bacterium]
MPDPVSDTPAGGEADGTGGAGRGQLVWGVEHLERVVDAVCGARVSVAVMTADVKGMLVPVKRVPARVMGAIRAAEAERRKARRKGGGRSGRGDAIAMLEVRGGAGPAGGRGAGAARGRAEPGGVGRDVGDGPGPNHG